MSYPLLSLDESNYNDLYIRGKSYVIVLKPNIWLYVSLFLGFRWSLFLTGNKTNILHIASSLFWCLPFASGFSPLRLCLSSNQSASNRVGCLCMIMELYFSHPPLSELFCLILILLSFAMKIGRSTSMKFLTSRSVFLFFLLLKILVRRSDFCFKLLCIH